MKIQIIVCVYCIFDTMFKELLLHVYQFVPCVEKVIFVLGVTKYMRLAVFNDFYIYACHPMQIFLLLHIHI